MKKDYPNENGKSSAKEVKYPIGEREFGVKTDSKIKIDQKKTTLKFTNSGGQVQMTLSVTFLVDEKNIYIGKENGSVDWQKFGLFKFEGSNYKAGDVFEALYFKAAEQASDGNITLHSKNRDFALETNGKKQDHGDPGKQDHGGSLKEAKS